MYRIPSAVATATSDQHRSTHALHNHAETIGIVWVGDGFRVERRDGSTRAVAFIKAGRVRSTDEAREFADRIARDPDSYLAVLTEFRVPGILDLRRGLPAVVMMPTRRSQPGADAGPPDEPWYGMRRPMTADQAVSLVAST